MASYKPQKTITKSGRVVKSPKNEYTDREFVTGSGFVGADHYDRGFDGNYAEMYTDKVNPHPNNYNYKDGFIVKENDDKEEKQNVDDEESVGEEESDEDEEESVGEEEEDEDEDEWSEYSDSDEGEESDEEGDSD